MPRTKPKPVAAPAAVPPPAPDTAEIARQNQALAEASATLFGAEARLEIVDPRELQLLKRNARFFKKEMFQQLVANIRRDRRLSSTPLCHLAAGRREVLSGNHRVQAAVEAGVAVILVLTILQDLSKSEQIAIQLSHNALVGQDDQGILAALWADIEELEAKLYAGLSSEALKEIKEVKLVTLSTPHVATKSVSFVFTEYEREFLDEVLDELGRVPTGSAYLFPVDQFNQFFALVQGVKQKMNIKNGSMAMVKILEIVSERLNSPEAAMVKVLEVISERAERQPGEEG